MVSDLINDKLQTSDACVFVKLYLLLYVDDTIIMAESATELQDCVNAVSHYCKLWSLKINTTKTKVLIFSKGKTRKIPTLSFNGTHLDVCFDYVYLGVKSFIETILMLQYKLKRLSVASIASECPRV